MAFWQSFSVIEFIYYEHILEYDYSKEFTLNINVDNKTMKTHHIELPHPRTQVNIRLYYEDYTGNVTPISVEVAPVV